MATAAASAWARVLALSRAEHAARGGPSGSDALTEAWHADCSRCVAPRDVRQRGAHQECTFCARYPFCAWHAPCAPLPPSHAHSQFAAAWDHVASMGDAETIRDDYARFLTSPNLNVVRKTMAALSIDVSGVINVLRSDLGARTFKPAISAIEGALAVKLRALGGGGCSPAARLPSARLATVVLLLPPRVLRAWLRAPHLPPPRRPRAATPQVCLWPAWATTSRGRARRLCAC